MARKGKSKDAEEEPTADEIMSQPPMGFWHQEFPEKMLAKKLKAEFNANETKFFQKDGKVVSKRTVICWPIRQKARESAHELRGDYAPRKTESKEEHIITHDITERLEKAIEATENAVRDRKAGPGSGGTG